MPAPTAVHSSGSPPFLASESVTDERPRPSSGGAGAEQNAVPVAGDRAEHRAAPLSCEH